MIEGRCVLMGLKNYNQQISVIRQADTQIAYLESYANAMNALIISLGSLWEENVDSGYILNAIGNCVYMASEIAYDYSVFSVNSIKWLNCMDDLERLARAVVPGKSLKVKPLRSEFIECRVPQRKDKIMVSPKDLLEFATQVDGYTNRLEGIHAKTSGLNKQIDKLILNKFASQYSLSGINSRIVRLKNINSNIAKALRQVSAIYTQAEKELTILAGALSFSAASSGEVKAQVKDSNVVSEDHSASGVTEKGNTDAVIDVSKNPTATEKETVNSQDVELGEIASKTDSEGILQYIRDRNSSIPQPESGGCTRYTRDKLATMGITLTGFGNGQDWYDNLKDGNKLTDEAREKVDIDAYPGDEFWDKLNTGEIKQPIYNLVVSYRGGATSDAQKYGHVLFVDAIVDGKVYYTDNWGATKTPQAISINDFRERYGRQNYQQQGIIHFTEKTS